MNWLITENKKRVNISEIPVLKFVDLREEIIKLDRRVIGFFGKKENDNTRLYVIMSDDNEGKLYISSSIFSQDEKEYESITQVIPAFHVFEREFYEEFGILPKNHPWLKPMRNHKNNTNFLKWMVMRFIK